METSGHQTAISFMSPCHSQEFVTVGDPDTKRLFTGISSCPECHDEFDGIKCCPIREACGHIKCRACFVGRLPFGGNYCQQCTYRRAEAKEIQGTSRSATAYWRTEVKALTTGVQNPPKYSSNMHEQTAKNLLTNPSSANNQNHPIEVLDIKKRHSNNSILNKMNSYHFKTGQSHSVLQLSRSIEQPTIASKASSAQELNVADREVEKTPVPQLNKSSAPKYSPSVGQMKRLKARKNKKDKMVLPHFVHAFGVDSSLYNCTLCNKVFKTKAHAKYHRFCDSSNEDKPYKCDECGGRFVAKSHYEYHLRTHTGERPFNCEVCGKRFNQRGKVTRHMKSHTGEKPYSCQQCDKSFANAQALRSHFQVHTGERPFACKFCHKRFTGTTNLKKHIITHTGERPFSCNTCGRSFGLKWTLDLHIRTHVADRPFACDLCPRSFSNAKDLRRHYAIHTGERPYKCNICGTAFRRKDNLDRHVRQVHSSIMQATKEMSYKPKRIVLLDIDDKAGQYDNTSQSQVKMTLRPVQKSLTDNSTICD